MVMNPSDPRISEWLDGRLSKQEAAEIELLVRSDRHLLRDVEEIRAARILLATVAKLKVAPDFSQSVMAAIARGVGDEISDPTGSPDLAGHEKIVELKRSGEASNANGLQQKLTRQRKTLVPRFSLPSTRMSSTFDLVG